MKRKNGAKNYKKWMIFLFISLILSMLLWQYVEYKRNVKISTLSITETEPSSIPLDIESIKTKYIKLYIKNDFPRNANNINITTDSNLDFDPILTNAKDFETEILRNIPGYYERKKSVESIISNLSTNPYLLLHYLNNQDLPKNSTIEITIGYKRWNLFNVLLEPDNLKFVLNTSDYEGPLGDMYESIYRKVGAGPTDDDLVYIEQRNDACPFWNLDEPETDIYKVIYYNCPFFENEADLGEDVTVEIYTSNFEQGKQAFRDWLAENELQESDKLRVEYVHVPK